MRRVLKVAETLNVNATVVLSCRKMRNVSLWMNARVVFTIATVMQFVRPELMDSSVNVSLVMLATELTVLKLTSVQLELITVTSMPLASIRKAVLNANAGVVSLAMALSVKT